MANKHYYLKEEFEVNLKVKVRLSCASCYFSLTETEIKEQIKLAKQDMPKELMYKLKDGHQEELTEGVYWNYEIIK